MDKNTKDIIAYLKSKDPDGMECFEYEPDDANKIVKYYYYERLNWCGCGLPETAVDTVAKFLEAMAETEIDNRHRKLKEYFKVRFIEDDPLLLCLAYTMDGAGFTDHGSSIRWAWLTYTITTTDADDAGSTWLARCGGNVQTSHSTLQGTLYGSILLTKHLIIYRRNATRQLQALLGTITHNHHFVQTAGVIYQRYLHGLLEVIDIHVEGTIAYVFYTEGQRGLHLRLKGEVSIDVSHDALPPFTLYNHGCAYQGFASTNICDMTCNQVLRYSQQRANRNECCNKQSFYHKFNYF